MIPVGLIEDEPKLRMNFETFFSLDKDVNVVFSFSSIEQFIAKQPQIATAPFIVFIDIGLPGISGVEGVEIISKYYPNAHLVILSGNTDNNIIWQDL